MFRDKYESGKHEGTSEGIYQMALKAPERAKDHGLIFGQSPTTSNGECGMESSPRSVGYSVVSGTSLIPNVLGFVDNKLKDRLGTLAISNQNLMDEVVRLKTSLATIINTYELST